MNVQQPISVDDLPRSKQKRERDAWDEHTHQATLIEWCNLKKGEHPELVKLYAIPNKGGRDKATTAKLVAEGLKKGAPDLCLPVSRGGYHSLYIEMKINDQELRPDQRKWRDWLTEEGNLHATCYTWEQAAETLIEYLSGKYTRE